MTKAEEIAAAIGHLESIKKSRGVTNGWLWEIPVGAVPGYGFDVDDDPRVPLVMGGPDVVLQMAVVPMLTILRDPLAELDDQIVALAIAINEGAAVTP